MALERSDIPAGLSAGVRALFVKSLEEASTQYGRLAMVLPSAKSEEKYAWLSSIPGMREFVDERQAHGLRDEQYGQIRLRVQSLAEAAARHKDRMVMELAAGGFASTCWDGKPFFSATHEGPDGTQGNVGSAALSASALQTAISGMARLVDDRAQPLAVVADTLVVPPELEWKALELLSSALAPESDGNAANVLKGRLDLIVSPYLADPDDWFLFCTRGALKPFILQERTPVELEALDASSGSAEAFMRDRYYYGVRARYNAGYGLWQLAYGSHAGA